MKYSQFEEYKQSYNPDKVIPKSWQLNQSEIYSKSKLCFGDYTLLKRLGAGNHGTVFSGCIKKNCNYAIKIQPFLDYIPIKDQYEKLLKECFITQMASDAKWGPKFYGYFECTYDSAIFESLFDKSFKTGDILFVMISELWDGSLEALLESHDVIIDDTVLKNFAKLVGKMHDDGIIHGDLFPRNVLYRYDKNNKLQLIPTDFGRSFTMLEYRNNLIDEDYIRDMLDHVLDFDEQFQISDILGITIENMVHYPSLLDSYLVEYIKIIAKQ